MTVQFRATSRTARIGENPPFGASTYTRAAASAAKHLRAYHLKKLVRSAIVDTDAKKKRKTNMNAAERIADPFRTADAGAHTLGFKVLPRADVAEARKKEHEAAQRARQEMEDKAKMRRETIAAAATDAAAAPAADAAKLTAAETRRHQRWFRRQDWVSLNEVEPWVAPCCAACCCGWSLQLIGGALATRGVRALHLRAVRWPAQRTSARAATRAAAERTATGAVLCSYFFG